MYYFNRVNIGTRYVADFKHKVVNKLSSGKEYSIGTTIKDTMPYATDGTSNRIPREDKDALYGDEGECFKWLWWAGDFKMYTYQLRRGGGADSPQLQWKEYTPEDSRAIELHFQAWKRQPRESKFEFNANYGVNFNRNPFIQYKLGKPDAMRPIVRIVYRWFWDSTDNRDPRVKAAPRWLPYSKEACDALENAILAHEVLVPVPGKDYEVNLVEMCQFRKGDRFARRDVRRIGTPFTEEHTNTILVGKEPFLFSNKVPKYWEPFTPEDHGTKKVDVPLSSDEGRRIIKVVSNTFAKAGRKSKANPLSFAHKVFHSYHYFFKNIFL